MIAQVRVSSVCKMVIGPDCCTSIFPCSAFCYQASSRRWESCENVTDVIPAMVTIWHFHNFPSRDSAPMQGDRNEKGRLCGLELCFGKFYAFFLHLHAAPWLWVAYSPIGFWRTNACTTVSKLPCLVLSSWSFTAVSRLTPNASAKILASKPEKILFMLSLTRIS